MAGPLLIGRFPPAFGPTSESRRAKCRISTKSAPRAADRAERRMRWAFEGRPPRAAPQLAPRPAPQLAPQPAPERALVAFAAADVSGGRTPADRRPEGQGEQGTDDGETRGDLVALLLDSDVFGQVGEHLAQL